MVLVNLLFGGYNVLILVNLSGIHNSCLGWVFIYTLVACVVGVLICG